MLASLYEAVSVRSVMTTNVVISTAKPVYKCRVLVLLSTHIVKLGAKFWSCWHRTSKLSEYKVPLLIHDVINNL